MFKVGAIPLPRPTTRYDAGTLSDGWAGERDGTVFSR